MLLPPHCFQFFFRAIGVVLLIIYLRAISSESWKISILARCALPCAKKSDWVRDAKRCSAPLHTEIEETPPLGDTQGLAYHPGGGGWGLGAGWEESAGWLAGWTAPGLEKEETPI